jgi:acyl-CoA thioesterase FadM
MLRLVFLISSAALLDSLRLRSQTFPKLKPQWQSSSGVLENLRTTPEENHDTTLMMHDQGIFLEHTDAYGVTFNTNYVVFAERAVGGRITSFSTMKLKRATSLADTLQIESQERGRKGTKVSIYQKTSHDTICVATGVTTDIQSTTLSESPVTLEDSLLPNLPAPHVYSTVVWPDELLAADGAPSTRAIINSFERARTSILGADALLDGLVGGTQSYLVARMSNFKFWQRKDWDMRHLDESAGSSSSDRKEVQVSSQIEPQGQSLMLFHQIMSDANSGKTLAQVDVLVCCVQPKTREICEYPAHLVAKLLSSSK